MRNEAIARLVGRRLKMRRRLLELTQKQVAARCGLTFQQIQKYEAGAVDLSLARVVTLANILRTPLSELFDGLQMLGDDARAGGAHGSVPPETRVLAG